MKSDYDKIFSKSNCVPEGLLLKYVNKQSNFEEQHCVEIHTLDCEMCADILAGMMLQKEQEIDFELNIKELEHRINKKVQSGKQEKKQQWQWMAVAASIALLIGIGFYFYNQVPEKQLAENLPKNVTSDKPVIDSIKQIETIKKDAAKQIQDKEDGKGSSETAFKIDIPKTTKESNLPRTSTYKKGKSLESEMASSEAMLSQSQDAIVDTQDALELSIGSSKLEEVKEHLQMESNMSYASGGTAPNPSLSKSSGKTVKSKSVGKGDPQASTINSNSLRLDFDDSEFENESKKNDTLNNSLFWPYVNVPSANAYILMQAMPSISLVSINQSIKTKTVTLNSNVIVSLINTVNSTNFTANFSQVSMQWKYVIVLNSVTSKPIAYIAVSEDEKTAMKFPEESFSNSSELIYLLKSLLQ